MIGKNAKKKKEKRNVCTFKRERILVDRQIQLKNSMCGYNIFKQRKSFAILKENGYDQFCLPPSRFRRKTVSKNATFSNTFARVDISKTVWTIGSTVRKFVLSNENAYLWTDKYDY